MKNSIVLFLTFVLSFCMGCMHGQQTRYATIDDIKMQTVALVRTVHDRNGKELTVPYCTGVWVNSDVILTADHCALSGARAALVEEGMDPDDAEEALEELGPTGAPISYIVERDVVAPFVQPTQIYGGTVIAADEEHDLALVRVGKGSPPHHVARLAQRIPHVGAPVHVVGQTIGLYWTYTPATVGNVYSEIRAAPTKHGPFIELIGSMNKGNSGGGAWDEDGNLIGMADFIPPVPGIVFFVHVDTIRAFMKSNKLQVKEGL